MNRKARRKAQAAARKRLGWEDRLEKYLDTSDGEKIRRFARVTHQAGCPHDQVGGGCTCAHGYRMDAPITAWSGQGCDQTARRLKLRDVRRPKLPLSDIQHNSAWSKVQKSHCYKHRPALKNLAAAAFAFRKIPTVLNPDPASAKKTHARRESLTPSKNAISSMESSAS